MGRESQLARSASPISPLASWARSRGGDGFREATVLAVTVLASVRPSLSDGHRGDQEPAPGKHAAECLQSRQARPADLAIALRRAEGTANIFSGPDDPSAPRIGLRGRHLSDRLRPRLFDGSVAALTLAGSWQPPPRFGGSSTGRITGCAGASRLGRHRLNRRTMRRRSAAGQRRCTSCPRGAPAGSFAKQRDAQNDGRDGCDERHSRGGGTDPRQDPVHDRNAMVVASRPMPSSAP